MFKSKIVLLTLLGSVHLSALTDKELALSINLSGKQRMLSQKMTKESFLIYNSIDEKINREKLLQSSQQFDKTLNGLLRGDSSLKLVATHNGEIEEALKKVQKLWEPFYQKIQLSIDGKLTPSGYQYLEKNNLELLKEMNHVVVLYTQLKKSDSRFKLANDINLAGKQRMLTQKMAKDLLFIEKDIDRERYLNDLKESKELFSKTLKGLVNGNKELNLIGTRLPKITKQLKKVDGLWKDEMVLISKPNENIKESIDNLDTILVEMNRAVTYYTQSLTRQKQRFQLSSIIGDFMNKTKRLKKRVNLSGKQRMLTQKMTKLALLISSNVDIQKNRENLSSASKLYDKTLNAFKSGDKELGCVPMDSKEIKGAIATIEAEWNPFYTHIQKIIENKDSKKISLAYVVKHNEKLLKLSNDLVKKFETADKSLNYLDKARLRVVNVAGRERMLSQKMTKEKLLVEKGVSSYGAKLQATVELFDNSLSNLIQGNQELKIPKTSNDKIKKQLERVQTIWSKLKPLYLKEKISKSELDYIIKENPTLLSEMNRMVGMAESAKEY